ncbi:hypothetical protein BC831DRAFT_161877 [Entophlyctis helioformis]|nr:hypothetical protein BC831DRAFT_161877 [Entophlyctis helioformis]
MARGSFVLKALLGSALGLGLGYAWQVQAQQAADIQRQQQLEQERLKTSVAGSQAILERQTAKVISDTLVSGTHGRCDIEANECSEVQMGYNKG